MELFGSFPVTHDEEMLGAQRPAVPTERSDEERLALVQEELATGFEALEDLGPAVTIFGSARVPRATRSTSWPARWRASSGRPAWR